VATSSALAVAIIGAVAISVIAMQRRAVRRRQLRYRVTQAASRAIHAGLNRSTAAVETVRAKLSG
jgi:type II secretory pathway pseudopilin PulG